MRAMRPKLAAAKSRLREHLLGTHAIGVLTEGYNGLIVVNPYDVVVGETLGKTGQYDRVSIERLSALIDSEKDVLVVGTHVGALFIPLAAKCRRIVGYEANPETFRLLELNVVLNRLTNVELHNFAAGESAGIIEFWSNAVNSGGSKRKPAILADMYTKFALTRRDVPQVSIDEHQGNRAFELIVMDIEGSEYFALKGMQGILERSQHLYVEYLPHALEFGSNVTEDEFLAQIAPHFDHAINFADGTNATKNGFLDFLEKLKARGEGADILFSKNLIRR